MFFCSINLQCSILEPFWEATSIKGQVIHQFQVRMKLTWLNIKSSFSLRRLSKIYDLVVNFWLTSWRLQSLQKSETNLIWRGWSWWRQEIFFLAGTAHPRAALVLPLLGLLRGPRIVLREAPLNIATGGGARELIFQERYDLEPSGRRRRRPALDGGKVLSVCNSMI